jgi:hypothetical protein
MLKCYEEEVNSVYYNYIALTSISVQDNAERFCTEMLPDKEKSVPTP